jgi:excisionase family DNA binding protein
MKSKIYTTEEVAKILRVSDEHVRAAVRKGFLKAYKEGRKGGYRIEDEDVEAYVKMKKEMQVKVVEEKNKKALKA